MRQDHSNSYNPDAADDEARWEAYRALMRKKGDDYVMPGLEGDPDWELGLLSQLRSPGPPRIDEADSASEDDRLAPLEPRSFAPVDPRGDSEPVLQQPDHEAAETTLPQPSEETDFRLRPGFLGATALLVAGLITAIWLGPERHVPGPTPFAHISPAVRHSVGEKPDRLQAPVADPVLATSLGATMWPAVGSLGEAPILRSLGSAGRASAHVRPVHVRSAEIHAAQVHLDSPDRPRSRHHHASSARAHHHASSCLKCRRASHSSTRWAHPLWER